MKRIGLAERSGRGIDRIYEGTLRYGKGVPDYSQSSDQMVRLFIPNSLPDKSFISMLTEEEKKHHHDFSVYALLVLNYLKKQHRVQFEDLKGDFP